MHLEERKAQPGVRQGISPVVLEDRVRKIEHAMLLATPWTTSDDLNLMATAVSVTIWRLMWCRLDSDLSEAADLDERRTSTATGPIAAGITPRP